MQQAHGTRKPASNYSLRAGRMLSRQPDSTSVVNWHLSPRVSLVQKERRVFSLLQAAAVEWSWWWSQRRTGQADSPSFRGDKFVRERALSLADPTIKTVR
jgi:hypothetical protein